MFKVFVTYAVDVELYIYSTDYFEFTLLNLRLMKAAKVFGTWCIQRASDGIVLAQSKDRK